MAGLRTCFYGSQYTTSNTQILVRARDLFHREFSTISLMICYLQILKCPSSSLLHLWNSKYHFKISKKQRIFNFIIHMIFGISSRSLWNSKYHFKISKSEIIHREFSNLIKILTTTFIIGYFKLAYYFD